MIFLEIDNILDNMEIIDLRDSDLYKKYHLSNSVNISFAKLIIEPAKYLKKEKKYILICEKGIKSFKISQILNKMGYNTYSLKNGISYINNKN